MDARRKVILRQMVRPPYVYRWGALIGTFSTMVAASTIAVSTLASGGAAASTPVRTAPAAAAPPALVRTVSSKLLTATARPGRSVALTFDDGPDPRYTPRLLSLLAEQRVRATFCVLGDVAARHPELIRSIVAGGHVLCDHTMAHDASLGDRAADADGDFGAVADALTRAAGPDVPIRFFRAPEGRWTTAWREAAAQRGLWSLGWSVDSRDWTRPGVERIVADVQSQAQPGAVILFHDGGGNREQTLAAVERIVPWLREQGYAFDVPA